MPAALRNGVHVLGAVHRAVQAVRVVSYETAYARNILRASLPGLSSTRARFQGESRWRR